MFLFSDDIEKRIGWKPGHAARLARQRRLPHYIMPDGSVRFIWEEIEPLIVRVPESYAATTAEHRQAVAR